MPNDYLPRREAELRGFCENFNTKINAAPGDYGLDLAQATAYDVLFNAFQTAYSVATDPGTNSHANIVTKNAAKVALIAETRELARQVQGTPTVTDAQKAQLGLPAHDNEPTPIPVPRSAPGIEVVSTVHHSVRVRLQDRDRPESRGRPEGTQGASIFAHVGQFPPPLGDIARWEFMGIVGRTTADVGFDTALPSGTTVWITAFWFNPRGQSGPAATPVSAQLPGTYQEVA